MIPQPRKQTQLEQRKERERLYDYYGIPYGIFDGPSIPEQVERDWSKAIAMIAKNEKIPMDLKQRLLKYKKKNS